MWGEGKLTGLEQRRCDGRFHCSSSGWPYFFLSLLYLFQGFLGSSPVFGFLSSLNVFLDHVDGCLHWLARLPNLFFLDSLFYAIFLLSLLICVTAKSVAFMILILGWFRILFYYILENPDKLHRRNKRPLPPIRAYSVRCCILSSYQLHPSWDIGFTLFLSKVHQRPSLLLSWISKYLFAIQRCWYLIFFFGPSQEIFCIFLYLIELLGCFSILFLDRLLCLLLSLHKCFHFGSQIIWHMIHHLRTA